MKKKCCMILTAWMWRQTINVQEHSPCHQSRLSIRRSLSSRLSIAHERTLVDLGSSWHLGSRIHSRSRWIPIRPFKISAEVCKMSLRLLSSELRRSHLRTLFVSSYHYCRWPDCYFIDVDFQAYDALLVVVNCPGGIYLLTR
jgi:hypothetical protein